jgi:hypothetical protein
MATEAVSALVVALSMSKRTHEGSGAPGGRGEAHGVERCVLGKKEIDVNSVWLDKELETHRLPAA